MKWLFSLAITLLLFTPLTFAQEISLFVAGVNVRLGMPKLEALNKIQKPYDTRHPQGQDKKKEQDDLYFIVDTSADNTVGTLSFENEKLIGATKEWLYEDVKDSSSLEFTDVLYGLLKQMEERGETRLTMTTRTFHEPGISGQLIFLRYGKRVITFGSIRNKERTLISITEEIRLF